MSEQAGRQPMGEFVFARINVVWALVFYLSLGQSLIGSWGDAGEWPPWAPATILALCAASAALFHTLYWPVFERAGRWPLRPPQAWLYFGGQLAVLTALLAVDRGFLALGFAVFGQICGGLRPRHWALPLAPLVALLAWALGTLGASAPVDWAGLASFLMLMVVWLLVALLISQLFQQHYRLLGLVEELRRAKTQIEDGAAERAELAVLRERTRLAREMHDSLGHALVSVTVKLEAAERLYRVDPARGDAELAGTRGLVRETMAELRRSLADLRAPLSTPGDLAAGLRRLADELHGRGGPRVAVQLPSGPLPPDVAEALLLIAREALANVERHANATSATVALERDGGGWRLVVADDGVGVGAEALRRPGHFGVLGMRERAAALRGTLEIAAGQQGGTRVEVRIPDATGQEP